MKKTNLMVLVAAGLALLVTGCSGFKSHDFPDSFYGSGNETTYSDARSDEFLSTINNEVDIVLGQLNGRYDGQPLLIASTQKIDSLNTSGTIGRTIGEAISAHATQKGFAVVEAKLRSTLAMNIQGEQLLSRELKDIALLHKANAVIVSSWAAGGKFIYVTVKCVRVEDGVIIGSRSFTLPIDSNIKAMM